MEFEYGIATANQKKVKKVEIEKIFIEKSWKLGNGNYPSFQQLYEDGKDIAILLLKHDINENSYPKLHEIIPLALKRKDVTAYGYPGYLQRNPSTCNRKSVLRKSDGVATISSQYYENGWGIFRYNAWIFKGICFFFELQ